MADEYANDPATGSPAATDPPVEETGDAADLSQVKRDLDEAYDRLLRKTAEFDNYRKRVERERREQGDRAATDLLRDLLSVVDDFERALAAGTGDTDTSYRHGIELIYTKLHDLLRKQGVRP